ncbi:MAG TPA: DUF1329 domain-containing protein [Fontimonas sp.]
MKRRLISTLLAALGLVAMTAQAKVTPEEAARLGKSLTPVGAQAEASQDGRIPAWSGGMLKLPPMFANYDAGAGAYYPDPFPEDQPLLKITPDNLQQYAAQLPAGAAKLLTQNKGLYFNVYPTRRTATYPQAILDATVANATTAELQGDDALSGAKLGFPFPIPKTGAEAMVNHRVRYRGDSVVLSGTTFVVSRDGKFQLNGFTSSVQFSYANVAKAGADDEGLILQLMRRDESPARLAGSMTLIWEYLDGRRDAWQYSPGSNRIRRAPIVAYDNPVNGADGLQSVDQTDMFNGSQSRYSWKLLGKKEMYIPYNNYRLVRPELKYADIIKQGHLNPQHLRYELHRVWIVEATLKPGQGNIFKKRVFYIDEDSWNIAAVDCYDSRDQLWRYQEGFVLPLVADKAVVSAPQVIYDLFSGRYIVNNLPNEQGFIAKFGGKLPAGYFTPQNLQKLGRS